MNDPRNPNSPLGHDPELSDTARMLEDAASQIAPDPAFVSRLERRLASSHPGPEVSSMFSLRRLAPALLWVAAAAAMVFVINWAIRSLAPEPVPAARHTPAARTPEAPTGLPDQPTPVASGRSYDWHGTTLYFSAELPASPGESAIYAVQTDAHASIEEAVALAERFGIQGNAYQSPGELPDTTDYLITDGRQSLRVRSAGYFSYTADIVSSYNDFAMVQRPDAEDIIRNFLESHAFMFQSRIAWSELRSGYVIEPLASDGTPLRYEFYAAPMMLVTLNEEGQVASLQASLLHAAPDPVGNVGIISSEEALQRLLDPNRFNGMMESMHAASAPIHQWNRHFPVGQPMTIFGSISAAAPVQPDVAPFIQIDGYPATGQVSGMEKLPQPTYIEAQGQFVEENGVTKFAVESWSVPAVHEEGILGTLKRVQEGVVLDAEDGSRYLLPDVPDDVPMPFELAYVVGTNAGDVFEWKMIDNRMAEGQGGGGGGGGGTGFYKLNLSGTPVPFPPPTAIPTEIGGGQYVVQPGDTWNSIASNVGIDVGALMQTNGITDPGSLAIGQILVIPGSEGRRIEGLRGMLNITLSKQSDGSQLAAYGFLPGATSDPGGYMLLEGQGLEALQAYNNRPVDVWGTLRNNSGLAVAVLEVERFEIPYPDLQFQVLRGTQKLASISGQPATLFTAEDGTIYIQLLADGTTGGSLVGSAGDEVLVETLAIPEETVDGYPALRVFSASLAVNPKNGQPVELPITADKPSVVDGASIGKPPTMPSATIERVELIHFTNDLRYAVPQPDAQPPYFQPVWRFYGHYSNGDELEILVQAARDEFLLPQLDPYLQGG